MKNFFQKEKGFTLVETLVAISMLMIGLAAAFTVAQSGISSSSFAKDRITAYFLAQEAIEAVKGRRDNNLLIVNGGGNIHWLEGLTIVNGVDTGPCGLSAVTQLPSPCDFDLNFHIGNNGANINQPNLFRNCADSGMNNCTLKHRTSSSGYKFYGYGGGSGSPLSRFQRQITIDEFDPGVEARVTVRVSWYNHSFVVSDNIFSWF